MALEAIARIPRTEDRMIRALSLCLIVLLAGCAGGSAPVTDEAPKKAPEFTLVDLDGSPVSLSDSAGQLRLVDFWATWCEPCKEEIPWYIEFHRKYGESGFKIIAINPEEEQGIVRDFVEAWKIPYTNLAGAGDEFEAVRDSYDVFSYPTGFLVDGEGHIVEEFRGAKSKRVLERRIRELLELPPLG
jgi:cytochrome c biogenesis protein CcmG/thiol:disulfide interchange protein DsbE